MATLAEGQLMLFSTVMQWVVEEAEMIHKLEIIVENRSEVPGHPSFERPVFGDRENRICLLRSKELKELFSGCCHVGIGYSKTIGIGMIVGKKCRIVELTQHKDLGEYMVNPSGLLSETSSL